MPFSKHIDDMKASLRAVRCDELAKEMCEEMEQSKGFVPVPLALAAKGTSTLVENFNMSLQAALDHSGKLELDLYDLRLQLQMFRDSLIYALNNKFKAMPDGNEIPMRQPFSILEIKRKFRRGGEDIKEDEESKQPKCPPQPSIKHFSYYCETLYRINVILFHVAYVCLSSIQSYRTRRLPGRERGSS